jgi:hypothetical protein
MRCPELIHQIAEPNTRSSSAERVSGVRVRAAGQDGGRSALEEDGTPSLGPAHWPRSTDALRVGRQLQVPPASSASRCGGKQHGETKARAAPRTRSPHMQSGVDVLHVVDPAALPGQRRGGRAPAASLMRATGLRGGTSAGQGQQALCRPTPVHRLRAHLGHLLRQARVSLGAGRPAVRAVVPLPLSRYGTVQDSTQGTK